MTTLEPRHPEKELLLPYLDGELSRRQAWRVRRHVEACWECRSELEELQKMVGECVRYRRQLEGGAWPQPPHPWRDLSPEFVRIDAAARSSARRPFLRWAALAASAAALAAATITLRTWESRPAGEAPPLRPQSPAHKIPQDAPSPPAGTPARTETLVPSARVRAPERQPLVIEASLADELRAVAALHQLGADLGDPVEVAREGGRVIVRGTGLSPVLERQIREAFLAMPGVELQFPGPGVASGPPSGSAATETPPRSTAMPPASLPSAAPNRLEEQLGGHAQFEIFSSQLLDHQEAAMARIYALRRLAMQFPADEEKGLSPGDQRLLHDLGREHVNALSREIAAIRRLASPVLASMGASATPGAAADAATWQVAARDLFVAGRQVDSLIAALIGAAAPEPASQAGNPSQALLIALAQIRLSMQQCEQLLTR
jgi:hypothetical protein